MSLWHDLTHAAFWLDLARGDFATWIQLTPYVYATFEGLHLVGVAFFFGSLFLLDLRLLRSMPELVAGHAAPFLLRISVPAFVSLAITGTLLFIPSADRYATSPIFFMKMGAIAAGGVNALVFHVAAWKHVSISGERAWPRWTARTTAIVSIGVWVTVIALGRGMGYEAREPPAAELELPWLETDFR
jgi:hypothetical protein